jgi:hypothetical protein
MGSSPTRKEKGLANQIGMNGTEEAGSGSRIEIEEPDVLIVQLIRINPQVHEATNIGDRATRREEEVFVASGILGSIRSGDMERVREVGFTSGVISGLSDDENSLSATVTLKK